MTDEPKELIVTARPGTAYIRAECDKCGRWASVALPGHIADVYDAVAEIVDDRVLVRALNDAEVAIRRGAADTNAEAGVEALVNFIGGFIAMKLALRGVYLHQAGYTSDEEWLADVKEAIAVIIRRTEPEK